MAMHTICHLSDEHNGRAASTGSQAGLIFQVARAVKRLVDKSMASNVTLQENVPD